jgi:hypothetical protein
VLRAEELAKSEYLVTASDPTVILLGSCASLLELAIVVSYQIGYLQTDKAVCLRVGSLWENCKAANGRLCIRFSSRLLEQQS